MEVDGQGGAFHSLAWLLYLPNMGSPASELFVQKGGLVLRAARSPEQSGSCTAVEGMGWREIAACEKPVDVLLFCILEGKKPPLYLLEVGAHLR